MKIRRTFVFQGEHFFAYLVLNLRSTSSFLLWSSTAAGQSRQDVTDEIDEPMSNHVRRQIAAPDKEEGRSEEHTSELQSRSDLVCRLLLEKKKTSKKARSHDIDRDMSFTSR